mmetsp:Transcript_53531/g.148456  ORF Transcript_53531/g.148456 Transcript_53531/m.148456 type:complete len:377 (-) Transcript_53531:363-1493(-)
MDGHAVIRKVETDHEQAVSILRLRIRKPCLEAQDLPVIVVELVEILLRRLRYQVRDRCHRVVPRAVARVGGCLRAWHGALGQLHRHLRGQLRSKLVAEVHARELICVIDEEVVVAQKSHVHAHGEVVPMNELGLLPWSALRAVHPVVADGHLGLSEEDRKVVPAAIQRVHLSDLYRVIRQEEEDDKWPPLELRGGDVVHDRKEAQDLAIVLQELLHVRVDVAAPEHDLAVQLLVGPRLGCCCDLDGLARLHERVRLLRNWSGLLPASLGVVGAGELVTVCEDNRLPVDVQGLAHLQVLGHDVSTARRRKAVAAYQLPLRNAAVVLARLHDMASVVLQIVKEVHLAHPVVLKVRFHNSLLEVTVEAQHMPVKSIPRR